MFPAQNIEVSLKNGYSRSNVYVAPKIVVRDVKTPQVMAGC